MAIEHVFEWSRKIYGRTLWTTLRHKWVTLAMSFALLGATVYMFRAIPKGFIPTVDTGQINATTEFAQGIGFPTVPDDRSRVRTIVTAEHTREELETCLAAFEKVGRELALI